MFYLHYMHLCFDDAGEIIYPLYEGATWNILYPGYRKLGARKRVQYRWGTWTDLKGW